MHIKDSRLWLTAGQTLTRSFWSASRLPSHLHFLLTLSQPPDPSTLTYADSYMDLVRNPEKAKSSLTWADILAEEPFEGQHWEGAYGLPPGAVRKDEDSAPVDSDSSPSLSPLEDEDDFEELSSRWDTASDLESRPSTPPQPETALEQAVTEEFSRQIALYSHRDEIESLQAQQYWRSDWRDGVRNDRPFNIGDPSTLNPAFERALNDGALARKHKYINEHDAVREVLMGLQGRRNLLITWISGGDDPWNFLPDPTAPSLRHLSPAAQNSILSSFARTATTVEHLRSFVSAMTKQAFKGDFAAPSRHSFTHGLRSTRCFEAFSEAVEKLIRSFDRWCAAREEDICMARAGLGAPRIVSLLELETSITGTFSETFEVLLQLLRDVVQRATQSPEPVFAVWTFPDLPKRMPPAALSTLLLDGLLQSVHDHASRGDGISADALLAVFADSAEPLWRMLRRWLRDGTPVRDSPSSMSSPNDTGALSEEFFVEDNELPLLDPDFWADAFMLRDADADGGRAGAVPHFLQHAAPHVLAAGKAVGLLHALGMPMGASDDGVRWLGAWRSLGALLEDARLERAGDGRAPTRMSADDFSRLVYDELVGPCARAKQALTTVLVEECELWVHLQAIEELYLMRRGDVLSGFLDVLFTRMDAEKQWGDFHFLNTAFSDVVASSGWLDPALVRISYRGSRTNTNTRSVRTLEGFAVEYAVPFPLTYVWGPRALQAYSALFVFVLQIRRAKHALERILVRHKGGTQTDGETKMFYAMRGKLSWFVNVLLNFICTSVLHTQVVALHEALRKAGSLDEMIDLHNEHLNKLEARCFLHTKTASLHRAILSILDMALYFSDCFLAYAGASNTCDLTRQSITPMKAHRSRRLQQQRRNVIGFGLPSTAPGTDSSSDEEAGAEPEVSYASNISFEEEAFVVRLDKMASELDALVRFVRRGVEGLAGGADEAAAVFDVLAFALEDWDL
ncbi:gamma-tubulin complex component [Phanerochaete sordida]|uniref:Spindle pole body component n=1 Tax=Phanerochaete sordida TaxID=48140 RepID=A0A9P3FYX3_9APHY|nr:gamma-tubulin complex component [Phanerochaete sordida]